MLYKIDGKYYMLRNREYVEVDIKLDNNELNIKPKRENVIENNDNIKARGILIEKVIEDLKKKQSSSKTDNSKQKNKYDI